MIRAAAAQAAATLMAPIQPEPANYVAISEVIEAYIRDGKEAAFALCPAAPEDAQADEPVPPAEPIAAVVQESPSTAAEPEPEPTERDAEVIPLALRGKVPGKQEDARRFVEKRKKEKVDSILAEANVAKAKVHKQRLIDSADEASLSNYPVIIKGNATTLGAYLASL